jgi:hypothetical protein
MNMNGKFGPNTIWLVALFTLGAALGLTKLVPAITGPITPKAMAAVYFAVFGTGATVGMFLSRASALRSIGAFALAGVGLGIFYFVVVGRTFAAAGSGIAAGMGIIFAVAFAVDALAAGIAGTLFGLKLRRGLPVAAPR